MDLVISGQQLTMSSRDIADLTLKRHDNVMAICRSLFLTRVCPEIKETPYVNEQNGQTYTECRLTKRDSLVLIARLSPEFTARIVDRWQELEEKQRKPVLELPDFTNPAEAARAWAMQFEEKTKALAIADEAIRTKAEIGSRREATAMATASAKSKEVARLKHELGRNQAHATLKVVEKMSKKSFSWRPLKEYCAANNFEPRKVVDEQYGTVNAWPAIAWREVYGVNLDELFP